MKAKTIVSAIAVALLSLNLWSQDNLGIAGSNYAPANTVLVNPASIVDSKAVVDINFAGLGVYIHNDFAYLPKEEFNFFNLVGDPASISLPAYNLSRKKYYAYADVNVHGPSFTFVAGNYAFGLYTGARSVTDVRGVGRKLIDLGLEGINSPQFDGIPQSIKNLRINSLAWAEVGLTAGAIISKSGNDLVSAAVTVKRLIGVGGASIHLDNWNFAMVDSSMVSYTIRGQYGFNYPGWNTGRGWGVDLGLTYKRTTSDVSGYTPFSKSSQCTTCDYQFKMSAAILDVGRIKFGPEFYVNEFDETEESEWAEISDLNASDADGLSQEINEGMGFPTDAGNTKFRMWLPSALSLQFDYNLGHRFFLNSTLIAGVPWLKTMAPQRSSQLAFTPRFESKWLEIAAPIVLHEFKYPSVGAMIRLRSLIIGTDNLGTYLFNNDVYGADIYFNIKFNLFKSWKCGSVKHKVDKPAKSNQGFVPCPSW